MPSSNNPFHRALPTSLIALRHSNYRRYFFGHLISTLGTTIQQVAMAWLAYRMTGSTALLGLITFVSLAPQLLVGPLAGTWIDRHDKRRLLIACQALLALQAMLLTTMAALGTLTPGWLLGLAIGLGLLSAIDTPLRQALIGQLVNDRADLPNALALNAMLLNAARFLGPPIAGVLLATTSETLCFAVNAFSYFVLMAGLVSINSSPAPVASGKLHRLFKEGLGYAWRTAQIRSMLSNVFMVNLTVSSYVVLLPVFSAERFAGDAETLGWLWGSAGLGALIGSLFLATLRLGTIALSRLIYAATLISALAAIAFSLSHNWPVALLAMLVLGFGITTSNVGTNIVLQSNLPDELRGRVVSLYISTRFGSDALGGLLVGLLAARLGGPVVFAGTGVLLTLYTVSSGWRSRHARQPPDSSVP